MKKSATKISSRLRRSPRYGTPTSCAPLGESEYSAFRPPPEPRKNRLSNPARVSVSSRVLARVVDVKPATIIACSRSTTRRVASSRSRCRSRGCRMNLGADPRSVLEERLFPVIEDLIGCLCEGGVALDNFALDLLPGPRPLCARSIEQIVEVHPWVIDRGDAKLLPGVGSGLHYEVPLREVLQPFRKRLAAVEHLGDLACVSGRQLEEAMVSDRENRRAHLRRVLIEELIGRDY